MARESLDISSQHAEGLPALRAVAEYAHDSLADSGAFVCGGGGTGPGARRFRHRAGSALGVWQAEAADGISHSGGEVSGSEGPGCTPLTIHRAASVCGTDALANRRSVGVGRRGKMGIHGKGTTAPDLGGLSRALWESK